MRQENPSSGTLRGIGSVLAGFLAIVIPSIATDALMHGTGVFPPVGESMSNWLFVLALAYRIVYGVAGGYVTAWLAPRRPILHAMILAGIGVVLSTLGTVAMWDMGANWYPIALIVTVLPTAWAGAKLRGRSVRPA